MNRAFGSLPYRQRIFSRVSPPLLNHAQQGIYSVSCVVQFHLDRNHRQRSQRVKISAQIYRIFFGGDKAPALTSLPQLQQLANVLLRVRMMIAKESFGHWINTGSAQLQQEVLRPRNSTEDNRPFRNVLR